MSYSFIELSQKAGLTKGEATAAVEVITHYAAYTKDLRQHLKEGVLLSDYVLCELIDEGKIAGISFTGDTLEQYSSSLTSALRKLEAKLPQRPEHPLAPLEI